MIFFGFQNNAWLQFPWYIIYIHVTGRLHQVITFVVREIDNNTAMGYMDTSISSCKGTWEDFADILYLL